MIEHERSYVFTHAGADAFLDRHGLSPDPTDKLIEDYYLGQGKRVRKSQEHFPSAKTAPTTYVFTRKTGDKSRGYRFEFEEGISDTLGETLLKDAVMVVKKTRKIIPVAGADAYEVTMDFIQEPMRIAVLEIEAKQEIAYPIPVDVTQKLFGEELKECPLCSYTMFNRHIGIAGGPSSGKSETAKMLSHILNTQFGGNAFHVAEFATTFIQKYDKAPNFWEEFFVWHGQHERERNADKANIVISDCPTFLPYIYLLHLSKETFSPATALVLAKIYKRVLFDIGWYTDLIFLKMRDYKENNVRYQDKHEALEIESRVLGFLEDHNIPYKAYDYTQIDEIMSDLFYINA